MSEFAVIQFTFKMQCHFPLRGTETELKKLDNSFTFCSQVPFVLIEFWMKCSFYLKTTLTSTKPVKDSEQVFIVLKINVYRRFCEGFDKVIKLFAWNNFTQIFFFITCCHTGYDMLFTCHRSVACHYLDNTFCKIHRQYYRKKADHSITIAQVLTPVYQEVLFLVSITGLRHLLGDLFNKEQLTN